MSYEHRWMSSVRSSGEATDYEDAVPMFLGRQDMFLYLCSVCLYVVQGILCAFTRYFPAVYLDTDFDDLLPDLACYCIFPCFYALHVLLPHNEIYTALLFSTQVRTAGMADWCMSYIL